MRGRPATISFRGRGSCTTPLTHRINSWSVDVSSPSISKQIYRQVSLFDITSAHWRELCNWGEDRTQTYFLVNHKPAGLLLWTSKIAWRLLRRIVAQWVNCMYIVRFFDLPLKHHSCLLTSELSGVRPIKKVLYLEHWGELRLSILLTSCWRKGL